MANKNSSNKKTNKSSVSKNEILLAVIVAILLGFGGGFALGAYNSDNQDAAGSSSAEMKAHSHDKAFVVDAQQAPTVKVMVMEDAKSGYNVRIMTTNFRFAPENVNKNNVVGEGHAHLYVDGEKVGRVYNEWIHYDGNFEGTKDFRVTLNANDHSEYMIEGGQMIQDTVSVNHDSNSASHDEMHMHSSN